MRAHAHLVDALDDGPHGEVARAVDRLAVVGGSPRGAIDIDVDRHLAHGVRFDQVGHARLVQHPQTCAKSETHSIMSSGYINRK